ncbi:DUF2141 domain-containing protein [Kordiimonas sp. SCSIO 12610]|uniref:DUF2141 domain-containing protein n=1 Tax=Kordiimonas sp. SCSIO 12610 TaxID=2829597 RepID=UPI00210EC232|nr:DUF2141 domain-containing protein [Kordiimonas sp. SCSIO 12610]UTW56239.1 DUF2141 domain-containing protein [Kordiimonas sp. SCSIO 12610]
MTLFSTLTTIALPICAAVSIAVAPATPSTPTIEAIKSVPEGTTASVKTIKNSWGDATTVKLSVTLKGVQEKAGPMYVAVQKRENYQKWNAGAGGIYKGLKAGDHTYVYDVPAGEYAISVWHDSDNDGQFTMQGYLPLDGWGNSGNQNLQAPPTFDDVKITVSAKGSRETVNMHYPKD